MSYSNIVLNEPHASVEGLYDPRLGRWHIDSRFINDVILEWTDWHTDFLFHTHGDKRVKTVRFPYSRFIVDAERLWDDPMESIGQGIIYREFDGYRREVDSESEQRLLRLWQWHQARLRQQLSPGALLLDCHSFPEHKGDVDVCIGYNEDWSKPERETIDKAVDLFERNGYSVGVNFPYSNSETPCCPFEYHSMMLEINKRAYLEPQSVRLKTSRGRKPVNEVVNSLISQL